MKAAIRLDRKWLTIELSPAQYARIIGHSEAYVRRYCMRDHDAPKVQIRVRTEDVIEDIWDVKEVKEADQNH